MVNHSNIDRVLELVRETVKSYRAPVLERFNDEIKDPFWVLIPCILSLRSRDETTAVAVRNLSGALRLKIPSIDPKLEQLLFSNIFKGKEQSRAGGRSLYLKNITADSDIIDEPLFPVYQTANSR